MKNISIHAPLAGRDQPIPVLVVVLHDFNPRAPCGARQRRGVGGELPGQISIHAPLAGRDQPIPVLVVVLHDFNPHAPHGARRRVLSQVRTSPKISIHAPLTGRDRGGSGRSCCCPHFNPRAPRGARQQKYTNYFTHFCEKKKGFNHAFQSAFPPVDKRKSLKSRCEPP